MKRTQIISLLGFFLLFLFQSCFFSEKSRITLVKTGTPILLGTNATIDGFILDVSGDLSEYGHCWSLQPEPTVQNKLAAYNVKDSVSNNTSKAEFNGHFTSQMLDLQAEQKYYVRAYAIVSGKIFYSAQSETGQTGKASLELSTKNISPVTASNILKDQANIESVISGTSTRTITDIGFVYSESVKSPIISNSTKISLFNSSTPTTGNIQISLKKTITGLLHGTNYFVRAYVTTSLSGSEVVIYSNGSGDGTILRTPNN